MCTDECDDVPTLALLATQWGRIGVLGFGGPPSHIAPLRELCVVPASSACWTPGWRGGFCSAPPGAAPAAACAIVGAAGPLTAALSESWQFGVLAAAALALLLLRRGIVQTLLLAGLAGLSASPLRASVPR